MSSLRAQRRCRAQAGARMREAASQKRTEQNATPVGADVLPDPRQGQLWRESGPDPAKRQFRRLQKESNFIESFLDVYTSILL